MSSNATTPDDTQRVMALIQELETARDLIKAGFGELQEIHLGNDFYHLPQQLLASGLERLLKCYFCLVYEARNGAFPDRSFLLAIKHSLEDAKQMLIDDYFDPNGRALLIADLDFLKDDALLDGIINILSEFGKQARYYNLDIVAGSPHPPIDPSSEWERLETKIEDPSPYLTAGSMDALYRDYYPRVNAKIVAKLERFARAVCMQFTLGKHGGRLQQLSPTVFDFIMLKDLELGMTDYRRSVARNRKTKAKWSKRSKEKALKSKWPSVLAVASDYGDRWPFRAEEVVVECRDDMFCVVNVKGYDFALNGSAKTRFGYPDPHDSGVAILGRSIGPFIDLAFSLGEGRQQ
jgi:hypothetical protein